MKTLKYIYLSFVLLIFNGCTGFLDEDPSGSMTTDSNLSSLETATALANSAYYDLHEVAMYYVWGATPLQMMEFITGKASSQAAHSRFENFKNLALDSRAYYVDTWWKTCFYGIAKCNLAIQKLPEFTSLDQAKVRQLKAEAHYMRALYYFMLVRIFGDVPKVTGLQDTLSELHLDRSPVKEIYDEIIIPDLLEAESAGLPWKDETGRASLGAVKTLLADVYLTYAGYPLQGGKEYYSKAAQAAREVIESNTYSLFPDYDAFRNPANKNKGEFIFQIQFSLDKRHNYHVQVLLPQQSGISAYVEEYGGLLPTREFVESFAAGDLRTQERQFFFSSYPGHPSKFAEGSPELTNIDLGGYFIYKMFDEEAILNTQKATLNWTLYRYADLLLMYAEAQNEADGSPNSLAQECLNQVRRRAELPDYTDTNPDSFRETVWSERYFELCYENKMWFDMVRTQKVRNDITGNFDDLIGHTTIYDKTFTQTNLLFPIPQYELDANRKLVQNPGY
ncbi:MAG: RagB/SusD family nutrient uptake outer membrane protein [Tannerellaceae bacterium]|nr:RagB/SusD family nutrient uptake outer membrane protein [Tannerellaceae bacterium]